MKNQNAVDLAFWEEQGYVLVPGAVGGNLLETVVDEIWAFTGKDRDDPSTWPGPPLSGGGMVNMFCNPVLFGPRQSPHIYDAFTALWDRKDLWVTLNRANLNPPYGEHWHHEGFIHWDMDPRKPMDKVFQGVILLADTTADMGGFQCVPGSHRDLAAWHAEHDPAGISSEDLQAEIMGGRKPTPIEGKAGDLIIWDIGLLHGNSRNNTDRPRLAQYICMTPPFTARRGGLVEGGEDLRRARIDVWEHGPWVKELGRALGVAEGYVQAWLGEALQEPASLAQVPATGADALLEKDEVNALRDWQETGRPLEVPAVNAACKLNYGVTISGTATALLAREIGTHIVEAFETPIEPTPAPLDALGRKLMGLDPWE